MCRPALKSFFSSCSHRRRPATQRSPDALVTELSHPSHLVRHIALCRLLHAAEYRAFTPAALRQAVGRLGAVAATGSAAALLEQLARLLEAEHGNNAAPGGTATDAVEVLHSVAVAHLAAHGYRTVHGATPGRWAH